MTVVPRRGPATRAKRVEVHPIRYGAGMMACRVCGCTEIEACNPPCSWVAPSLCSGCAGIVHAITDWMDEAHRANFAALIREAKQIYAGESVLVDRFARIQTRRPRHGATTA